MELAPLRHAFASTLAKRGVELPTVARLLGHAPGSPVTLIYLHTDQDRMQEAVKALG